MSRSTVAEIDLNALENNWNIFREIQSADKIIPVIKANAYGHGDIAVAQKLQDLGATQCAVAMIEEAQKVRDAGFKGSLFILGPFAKNEISTLKQLRCTPIVGEKQNLLDLAAEAFNEPIHVKWDTGMNRLGINITDLEWFKGWMTTNPSLSVQAFCTHFLKSSDYLEESGHSRQQIRDFQKIESFFPQVKEKHILNSDGFFANHEVNRLPATYGARLGISLYGYTGIKNQWSKRLKPVMKLKTKIVHMTKVPKGQSVSYNASWIAQRESLVAVLPIGYADGYPRSLSNKGQVFLHGKIVPLVGIVCMDYLMIDVTDINEVHLGDEVELWGENLSLASLADSAGTIVYELLTALTARVPRAIVSR